MPDWLCILALALLGVSLLLNLLGVAAYLSRNTIRWLGFEVAPRVRGERTGGSECPKGLLALGFVVFVAAMVAIVILAGQ